MGFAARPVGAALFGHYGDRIGRKAALIATLLLMGIATAAIGVIPGADSIGLWAPTLLVIMRLLQGIGVGGEWSGSILLSMEWGDQRRRGLMASFPQMGVPIGLALSALMLKIFSTVSGDSFETWGWRIPFLLSLVLIAVGLWIRLSILETPIFAKAIEEQRLEPVPVVESFRRYPKEIILSAFSRMSEQAPFYIFTAFMLTYITEKGYSSDFALTATICAALLSLFSLPFFGHLSDSVGRKRIYILGAVIVGIGIYPYFAAVNSGVTALVFIAFVLALVPHDMQYGPQAAMIAESFSTNLRYSGAGLGYQLASVIAGGPAPLLATWLLEEFGSVYAIAGYVTLCSVLTIVAVVLMPDRSRIDITQDSSYTNERRVAVAEAT